MPRHFCWTPRWDTMSRSTKMKTPNSQGRCSKDFMLTTWWRARRTQTRRFICTRRQNSEWELEALGYESGWPMTRRWEIASNRTRASNVTSARNEEEKTFTKVTLGTGAEESKRCQNVLGLSWDCEKDCIEFSFKKLGRKEWNWLSAIY